MSVFRVARVTCINPSEKGMGLFRPRAEMTPEPNIESQVSSTCDKDKQSLNCNSPITCRFYMTKLLTTQYTVY